MTAATASVLVGVDGSEQALRAVRWAAAEAAVRGLPLRLVHAFSWGAEPELRLLTEGERFRARLLDRAHAELAAAAEAAAEVRPDLVVARRLRIGYPADVLATEAAGARLLVLGDRGRSRLAGLLLGSTAAAMAAHAPCPVVVVRGPSPAPGTGPVVVGVDDSPSSEAAIGFAFAAAAARAVPLLAVHTYPEVLADPILAGLVDPDVVTDIESRRLTERLAGWVRKFPGVVVRPWPAHGDPVRTLTALSGSAQLVVVGSRGRGALARTLLGSVGNALLHRSDCPVAVVRPDTAAAGRPPAVVVGVDGSPAALDAAEWAADLAARVGAPLRLVHVAAGPPADTPGASPSWLDEWCAAVDGEPEVGTGDVVEVLARRAARARLLVLGSDGTGAGAGMLVGSVALGVLAAVSRPVVLVRGTRPGAPPPRTGPVVVGVDGTATGQRALEFAADLAAVLGARLLAVHSWTEVAERDGALRRLDDPPAELQDRAEAELSAALAPVLAANPGLAVDRAVVDDTPLRALLAAAEQARLVVVGSRRHRPSAGMALGSTSQGLAEFAPCPVAVLAPTVSGG